MEHKTSNGDWYDDRSHNSFLLELYRSVITPDDFTESEDA